MGCPLDSKSESLGWDQGVCILPSLPDESVADLDQVIFYRSLWHQCHLSSVWLILKKQLPTEQELMVLETDSLYLQQYNQCLEKEHTNSPKILLSFCFQGLDAYDYLINTD